jgi:hypothetical protein
MMPHDLPHVCARKDCTLARLAPSAVCTCSALTHPAHLRTAGPLKTCRGCWAATRWRGCCSSWACWPRQERASARRCHRCACLLGVGRLCVCVCVCVSCLLCLLWSLVHQACSGLQVGAGAPGASASRAGSSTGQCRCRGRTCVGCSIKQASPSCAAKLVRLCRSHAAPCLLLLLPAVRSRHASRCCGPTTATTSAGVCVCAAPVCTRA